MSNKINKDVIVEESTISNNVEQAKINVIANKNSTKVKLTEFHSIAYIEMLRKTTYKDEKVVFILPNGKEV